MARREIFEADGRWWREADGRVGFVLHEAQGMSMRGAHIDWPQQSWPGAERMREMTLNEGLGEPQAPAGLAIETFCNEAAPLLPNQDGIIRLVPRDADPRALAIFDFAIAAAPIGYHEILESNGFGYNGNEDMVAIGESRIAVYDDAACDPVIIAYDRYGEAGPTLSVISFRIDRPELAPEITPEDTPGNTGTDAAAEDGGNEGGGNEGGGNEAGTAAAGGKSSWIAELVELKFEWEGPAPAALADYLNAALDMDIPEGEDPMKVRAMLSKIGTEITGTFWGRISDSLEDPMIGDPQLLLHGARVVNSARLDCLNGSQAELRETIEQLLVFTGARSGIHMMAGFDDPKESHDPVYEWPEKNLPRRYRNILRIIIAWFWPKGSAVIAFNGNRLSDGVEGPAPFFFGAMPDASGHDRLKACEALEAFLVKAGIGRRRIKRLLA